MHSVFNFFYSFPTAQTVRYSSEHGGADREESCPENSPGGISALWLGHGPQVREAVVPTRHKLLRFHAPGKRLLTHTGHQARYSRLVFVMLKVFIIISAEVEQI